MLTERTIAMRFAVCDDEREVRAFVKTRILRLYPDAEVELFDSGEALLAADVCFDIIYLDIKMDGKNGIETARALRARGSAAVIIFLTALREHVYEAFDVGAFNYLLKPIDSARFYEVLARACEQAPLPEKRESSPCLLVKNGRVHERVPLCDIVYAEVFDRKIIIHTTSGKTEFYGRISELEKQTGSGFFRPHRGFLINLAHVSRYDAADIFLECGSFRATVPIAKRRYPEFKKRYLDFIRTEDGR